MGRGLDILYAVGGLLSSPVWGFNLLRTGKWRTDWPGRFGFGPALAATSHTTSGGTCGRTSGGGGRLLIHAVSVGEVNATAALVAELQQRRPDLQIILSATTNTGHARAVQRYSDKLSIVRYPFDFTGSVRRLLDRVRPDAVALMELEVWPNFVQACRKRNIPVVVINGRMTARSFRRYQRLGPMIYRAFHQVTAAGVQTQDYAQRFRGLGVPEQNVTVLDTMKWDTAPGSVTIEGADELAADMGIDRSKPLIVAGSTGPGEEKILLDAKPDGVQLMLVPRKPERFDEVAALCPGIVRRTNPIKNPQSKLENYLLDTMGELRKAYALADVVIVGRTFCPNERLGGSDPIEPIALGKPTVQGTDYYNFAEVVEAFLADDGIVVSQEPMAAALQLLQDRDRAAQLAANGQSVIARRRGATQRYADLLLQYLPERKP